MKCGLNAIMGPSGSGKTRYSVFPVKELYALHMCVCMDACALARACTHTHTHTHAHTCTHTHDVCGKF